MRGPRGSLCTYQWKVWRVLPFGLVMTPRLFTKLLAPVATNLHLRTMSMYPYIDDIFHAQLSQQSVSLTGDASVRLHLCLGFIIKLVKSSLVPSQGMIHIGAWIDTQRHLVMPTQDKVQEITLAAQDLLYQGRATAAHLQSVVGLMASCHATVPLSLFYLRPMFSHLARKFKRNGDRVSTVIPLSPPVLVMMISQFNGTTTPKGSYSAKTGVNRCYDPPVLEALQFWANPSRLVEGGPLGFVPASQTLATDVSNHGWATVLNGRRCAGT